MNSIWNKNISLFKKRFPDLSLILEDEINSFESGKTPLPFEIIQAKNGETTALENGVPLHSKYNPSREALQLVSQANEPSAAVFFSCGLGYGPVCFAKKFPSVPLVIVEPDSSRIFAAFSYLDWEIVFSHAQVIFALGTDTQTAASLLRGYEANAIQFFATSSQTSHAQSYFEELKTLCRRDRQKDEINTNTLEKFGKLWLRNSMRNLHHLDECRGVSDFFKAGGENLPFIILAAGPSLEPLLPNLREIKKRAVLVCVDTALHACLRVGVEPDFIVLVDPQYACAMHLEFLSSPSSVLITESAAWPSVFRFKCRQIVLCSSLFPIGRYFEKRLGSKGELGAGGSVATTAWDFARKCGAREIYLAGMDLGFPGRQTHIRGSQFEEKSHRESKRTKTSDTDSTASLLGANPKEAKDYNGRPLLTDTRMSVFAWWFENAVSTAKKDSQFTYTLTPRSLSIPGIEVRTVENLLNAPSREKEKEAFFEKAKHRKSEDLQRPSFDSVMHEFSSTMESLLSLAKKGRSLCEKAIQDRSRIPQILGQLSQIDEKILSSDAKDAAALVFPTERQLASLSKEINADPAVRPIYLSRLIYTELEKSIKSYMQYIIS